MGMRFDFRSDCAPPMFLLWDLRIVHMFKNLPAMKGEPGSIPGFGRSPGKGNGNPLQYSCLENPMNRGAWWVTIHSGVSKSQTQLSNYYYLLLAYCPIGASPLPLDVGCLFWWESLDGCSAASCDFVVLIGEDGRTSFYSAILL